MTIPLIIQDDLIDSSWASQPDNNNPANAPSFSIIELNELTVARILSGAAKLIWTSLIGLKKPRPISCINNMAIRNGLLVLSDNPIIASPVISCGTTRNVRFSSLFSGNNFPRYAPIAIASETPTNIQPNLLTEIPLSENSIAQYILTD